MHNLFSFLMFATMLHLKNKSHKLREDIIFFKKTLNEPIVLSAYNPIHFQGYFCHNTDTLAEWIAPRVVHIIFHFLLKRILIVSFCLLIDILSLSFKTSCFTVAQMLQNKKEKPSHRISALKTTLGNIQC